MLKWSLGAIIILILMSGVALSTLLDQPERFRPQIEALAAEAVIPRIRGSVGAAPYARLSSRAIDCTHF